MDQSTAPAPMPPGTIRERAEHPRRYFQEMRQRGLVVEDQGTTWVLDSARADDILRDTDGFSNCMTVSYGRSRPIVPQQVDPPVHTRFRRLLNPLMSVRRMEALEPELTSRAAELIEGFAGSGRCDMKADFAEPFPAMSFMKLLGLPSSDIPFFIDFKNAVMRPRAQPGTPEEQAARQLEFAAEGTRYFAEVLKQKRARPGDDFISAMLAFEVEGERLTDEEIVDVCFQLPLAGLDSVASTLTIGFHFLAGRPDLQEALSRPDANIDGAVEELLRWETPVNASKRGVVKDTVISGCPVQAGSRIYVALAAANMDPARFDRPEVFDIDRKPNRHFAFGIGPHTCLGNNLARVELRVALREWHRRIPQYRLVPGVELVFGDDNSIRTIEALPLAW